MWVLNNSEIETLAERTNKIVFTDDFAPVENMMTPVVRKSGMDFLCGKYIDVAEDLRAAGKFDESIAVYRELLTIDRVYSIMAYRNIAEMQAKQDRYAEAAETLEGAIKYNQQSEYKDDLSDIHLKLGLMLKKLGRNEESAEHLQKAITGFEKQLVSKPDSAAIIVWLGIALSETGQLSEATKWFEKAVEMEKLNVENHLLLAQTLVLQKRYDEAVQKTHEGIAVMQANNRPGDGAKLQRFLEMVEAEKQKNKK